MSFDRKNKDELRSIAEDYAVDVSEENTKKEIIAELADAGVTWELYLQNVTESAAERDEEPEAEEELGDGDVVDFEAEEEAEGSDDRVLVKMVKAKPVFKWRGYTFTPQHPFVAMKSDDADELLKKRSSVFKQALPSEVKEYYS